MHLGAGHMPFHPPVKHLQNGEVPAKGCGQKPVSAATVHLSRMSYEVKEAGGSNITLGEKSGSSDLKHPAVEIPIIQHPETKLKINQTSEKLIK